MSFAEHLLVEFLRLSGTLGAATLAALFAIRKFHQEKLWEKKEANYTQILQSLHALAERARQGEKTRSGERDESDERQREIFNDAQATLKRWVNTGAWNVSEDVLKILKEYFDYADGLMEDFFNGADSLDLYVAERKYLEATIQSVRATALQELNEMKAWKSFFRG